MTPSPIPRAPHRLAWAVATLYGLGEILPAPGTLAGSLPTAAVWLGFAVFVEAPGPRLVVSSVATLLVTLLALWAADREARRRQLRDPGPIVIDEVAGQLLGLLVALPLVEPVTGRPLVVYAALAFLLFRLFDVAKPWPIRRLERLPGGLGVVADDLAAGLAAGLILGIGWLLLA